MWTSPEIDKIAEALALAQAEYKQVLKEESNPAFKGSKYETFESVLEATRPSLTKNGIALVQGCRFKEGRIIVISRLIHKSGQWIKTHVSIKPNADTAQAIGSAITYGKRYGGKAILGVDAEKDDDGNEASNVKDHKLQEEVEHLRSMVKDLTEKNEILLQKLDEYRPKPFRQADAVLNKKMDEFLIKQNISSDMFPQIKQYMEGKYQQELMPYLELIKQGKVT